MEKMDHLRTHSQEGIHNLKGPVQNGKNRVPCFKVKYHKIAVTGHQIKYSSFKQKTYGKV